MNSTGRAGIALVGVIVGVWALAHPDTLHGGGGDHAGPWPWLLAAAALTWVALGDLPDRQIRHRRHEQPDQPGQPGPHTRGGGVVRVPVRAPRERR